MLSSFINIFYRCFYKLISFPNWDTIKRLRGRFYSHLLSHTGKNLRIARGVQIKNPNNIIIGENCYFGDDVRLYAWDEKIIIGDNVLVAAGTKIITRKHYFTEIKIPIKDQGYKNAPVVIEDDVWIGFNSVVLPGVTLGKGSIIGAGAVITHNVEPYSIMGGVPARLIRIRTILPE